jgi:Zn-dependent M28 family amino/carboxypeptidase
LLYPSRGDFLAFVGNLESRGLVRDAIREFRRTAAFPSEGAALPASFPGVDWSDHWSFWQAGYPAILITDTAIYRDPNYHRASDTPEKVAYEQLARVTRGLESVIRALAQR